MIRPMVKYGDIRKTVCKTGVEVVWDTRIGPFMGQQSYRLLGIDMAENRNSPCSGSR